MAEEATDNEQQPLLDTPPRDEAKWTPPRGFIWVEMAIFANVFLYGLDSTITASTYGVISSDFDAANAASWLTTSYLVTSTAFQPLYGRFSDIFGRRICFFVSTTTFAAGCLGCGLGSTFIVVNLMRALTGFGGGGLMTMATIINSDMIPFNRRGMYQALQNSMFGFGAICGASLGGAIADSIGWRWCFLLQVPVSAIAMLVGYLVVNNQDFSIETSAEATSKWSKIDFTGALLLVASLVLQLTGLSVGGNQLPWSSPIVIASLIGSAVLLAAFLAVEARTKAAPVIPLRMLSGWLPATVQFSNVCAGLSAYAYLFMLPLFFQVVLLDTPTVAGVRLIIPSLATPIGGIIAGYIMSRYGHLLWLVRAGTLLMVVGNALVLSLGFKDAVWKDLVFTFPANLGQGITYPAILFTNLATFDHHDHAVSASTVYLIRSLGTVWGVTITSAVVQNTLSARLPAALAGVSDSDRIVDEIRHSVTRLRTLDPAVQLPARLVYYEGIRYAFAISTGVAGMAVISSLFARASGLRSTKG